MRPIPTRLAVYRGVPVKGSARGCRESGTSPALPEGDAPLWLSARTQPLSPLCQHTLRLGVPPCRFMGCYVSEARHEATAR